MKRVDVAFKSAEVVKCNAREQSVEVRIILNDGKDKALSRSVNLKEPGVEAEAIFNEVREKLKRANSGGRDYDDPLGGVVTVRFLQDEEAIVERLNRYFMTLRDMFRPSRFGQQSYWDIEKKVMSHKASFDDKKMGLQAAKGAEKADDDDGGDEDEPSPVEPNPGDELGITMMDRPAKRQLRRQ